MKICKVKPTKATCSACIATQEMFNCIDSCFECELIYDLLYIDTKYALVQFNGKIEKVNIKRVYDVEEMKEIGEDKMSESTINELIKNNHIVTDNISDGHHTFGELYHHRAILFSVICNQNRHLAWKSKKHEDGTMYDGMFIVGIETPEGQATYHYDVALYWDKFEVREEEYSPKWDGHTPDEAIERIGMIKDPIYVTVTAG